MRKFYFTIIAALLTAGCGTETRPVYTISTSATPAEAGSVSPATGEFDEGTEIEVVASADDRWVFSGWEGEYGSDNPLSLIMNGDKSITAHFKKREFSLNIETDGEGSVAETAVTAKGYEHGTTVQLYAIPEGGWRFSGWEGDLSGHANPETITLDRDKKLTAIFERKHYDLEISRKGKGEIDYAPAKSTYQYGDEIRFEALPDNDSEFLRWEGDLAGMENPGTLTVTGNHKVSAVFRTLDQAIIYHFSEGVIVDGKVHSADLRLHNNLPEEITLVKFALLNADGKEVVSTTDEVDIMSGRNLGYKLSFNVQPTEEQLSKYLTEWHIMYKGKPFIKKAEVGTSGSAAKIRPASGNSVELQVSGP